MAERFTPRRISAGVILIDPQGRVLMQLRDDNPAIMFPNHWGLTGGAGAAGESPEETARREVTEETGLSLGRIEPFKAYYFTETQSTKGARRTPNKVAADYELYLFHAPCTTPAEELVCGEGRELRFFAPDDIANLPIAYNHRDVLADFFGSPIYAGYLDGHPFGPETADDKIDPVELLLCSLDAGTPWFDALMDAIARWERPAEIVDGRAYRYLIGGEAFDWLLLAERLLAAANGRVPTAAAEQLLFEARAPAEIDGVIEPSTRAAAITDERLHELIGDSKHRAHLNYIYGVTVEEALQYAVELDIAKERTNVNIKDRRSDDEIRDPVYERIYGHPRAELLREFRDETRAAHSQHIALSELREFMYWLFKYRVKNQEPARVASDTRKALAQLSAIENATRRARARTAAATAQP